MHGKQVAHLKMHMSLYVFNYFQIPLSSVILSPSICLSLSPFLVCDYHYLLSPPSLCLPSLSSSPICAEQ